MRAIIIDDKDARQLLDLLKLEQFKCVGDRLPEALDPEAWKKAAVGEIHAKFLFVVCRWLQDQGASITR